MENVKKVIVKYNGKTVGYLAETDEGVFAFQYDDEWVKSGFSVSPFSLPLSREIFINEKRNFDGLFGVFRDSLPDGWGELLMNRLLQKTGINPQKLSPLTKLCLVNENGLGGLTYEPNTPLAKERSGVDFDELSKEISEILNDGNGKNLDDVYRFGGSSGGARPKAHVKIDGEDWIVKFPCRIDPEDIGEKEFVANETAAKCGIVVNERRLFPSGLCKGYFGAKRFDRQDGKRIHVISLAAILETSHRTPNLDYSHLFQVIESVCADKNELYEAFRRACFNVYYANKDDHGKNFAFLYSENKKSYELTPAFDLTSTPEKFEHEMTVNGNGNPTDDDLLRLAKRFGLSMKKCKEIMQTVKNQTTV